MRRQTWPPTARRVAAWLASRVAATLEVPAEEIDVRRPFAYYGLGSAEAVSLSGELEDWLGRSLPPTLAWDHPTIESLACFLAGEDGDGVASGMRSTDDENRRPRGPDGAAGEPIAVIGLACRLPGAPDADAFWRLLRDGVDSIREVPPDRWDPSEAGDGSATPGIRWGGFLEQVDGFDAEFFHVSPREAAAMDPQQRLLLEVTYEAFADAGLATDQLTGSRTGVFVGITSTEYAALQLASACPIDAYFPTGSALSIAANRISYVFGLRGPSLAVDTACSSSLVAVHLACQSLRDGECAMAVAGGVNVILGPAVTVALSRAGALAADGRCKTFDARADGYVRGEGAGAVVLKPLSGALADGDRIYAVVRGSAVNNDGASNGLMAPSGEAQEAVLRAAYAHAGIDPATVDYVEAHGTGTHLGDPIEARALGAVVGAGRSPGPPCEVGSVKTNIGHLEAAAGIAGLIKVALALSRRVLAGSLHFATSNPLIPFAELGLKVRTEAGPWPAVGTPARAGVSSFGFGGTNAHVVLEEAPRPAARAAAGNGAAQAVLLPLSARSPEALHALARAYRELLTSAAAPPLADLAYTASVRRTQHEQRLALIASSATALTEQLTAFLAGEARPGVAAGRVPPGRRRRVVFVFPGQGPQWWPLGRELAAREPVFRETLAQCAAVLRAHVDWELEEVLKAETATSRLAETAVCQPVFCAVQIALAALWRAWGIEPAAVVGHSLGEVAAAYVAGALGLEAALRVAVQRGRLIQRVVGQGRMAMVELPAAEARRAIAAYEGRLAIAAVNGPRATVLSGEVAALEAVGAEQERAGVFFRVLPSVDFASHGPQMAPLAGELEQALAGLGPRSATVPIYSTVTGQVIEGRALDGAYWARNLREPVQFAAAVEGLVAGGHDVFVELSPHPVLTGAVADGLRTGEREGLVMPSLRRGEEEHATMLGSLGALWAGGCTVAWSGLHPDGGRCVSLPGYPWQRERAWLEVGPGDGSQWERVWRSHNGAAKHPLLGPRVTLAEPSGKHIFEVELSLRAFPYLDDHRVQGAVVLAGASYAEMALAAAAESFEPASRVLADVEFQRALFVPDDGVRRVQLVLSSESDGEATFQVYSRLEQAADQSWTRHAVGKVRRAPACGLRERRDDDTPGVIRARCPEEIAGPDYYRRVRERGLEYGVTFRGVERLWRRDGEALAELRVPEGLGREHGTYHFHPAILDACLQVVGATLSSETTGNGNTGPYLGVGMEELRVHRRPGPRLWSHVRLRPDAPADAGTFLGDVRVFDEAGDVVLDVSGFRIRRVEQGGPRAVPQRLTDWFYELRWRPKPHLEGWLAVESRRPARRRSWLVFTDGHGLGHNLAARLEERGERAVLVRPGDGEVSFDGRHACIRPDDPDAVRQLVELATAPDEPPLYGVVHLWSLDASPDATLASLEAAQRLGCVSALHLVQALAGREWGEPPRLWLVTRGAQPVGAEPALLSVAQAPLWGLGKVIALEHPERWCVRIDLDPAGDPTEARSLLEELLSEGYEDQVALRGRDRFVARLERSATAARGGADPLEPMQLAQAIPGVLDSLALRPLARCEPGPGEIEIQVHAAGLNFVDVMSAVGLLPGGPMPLGLECAGTVLRTGRGVSGLAAGDEVVAIAPAAFGTVVTTAADLVVRKPARLSFAEAATIPVAFLTAAYALDHLARLGKGERVLIHAAAGGVGLAAVQLARRAGAEIFATVGSDEKRAFLESLGVTHVFSSRSLDFADEIRRRTGGEGVDVVLNSLAGDFIPASLSILAPYGRFLEIGKTDIAHNSPLGLRPFQNNLSFFAIDLTRVCGERPAVVRELLREIVAAVEEGTLRPLPLTVFPIHDAAGAFRFMAQRRNIGKVIFSFSDADVGSSAGATAQIRPDATYLLTGGLGGLGLECAQWLVDRGARHLVLLGRRGPSESAATALDRMRAAGAEVATVRADVARTDEVAAVLDEIRHRMPPLAGVLHAAGVLDDGILLGLDPQRFTAVMVPKVLGAWNLHALTRDVPLDFFVLFSSIASVLGSPGQGNYAAANAFLDALAAYRHADGLPALSINWGIWSEVGLAAGAARGGRFAVRGIDSMTPRQGVEVLGRLLRQDGAQIMVAPINWRQFRQLYPAASEMPLLADLVSEEAVVAPAVGHVRGEGGLTRGAVLAAKPEERLSLVENYLRERVAWVFRLPAAQLEVHQPLNNLGLESLMAVELRNQIEADLGVSISMMEFLDGPSVAQLATLLLKKLPAGAAWTPPPGATGDDWEEVRL